MTFRVPRSAFRARGQPEKTPGSIRSDRNPEPGTRNPELLVIHVASGREWRGGQRQVCYLTQALSRNPAVCQLVATGAESRLAEELRCLGVAVAPLSWGRAFDVRALTEVFRLVSRARAHRPILHAHDSHALTLAAAAAFRYRVPLVATRRVDFAIKTPWLWRRADRVVAISQAVRRVAERSGLGPDRIAVIPSGIPAEYPGLQPVDLRHQLGLDPNAAVVVSVGALVAHKDYRTLVGAAAQLGQTHPALHWVVAGEGPLRVRLEQQIEELDLQGRVHLIGRVPDGRAVIAAGDLFVASSREEGLNTSVLDAMQLGIPVVSTDAGGLPEALEGGAGLICAREDPIALARAVATVLKESSLRQRLISSARVRVLRFGSERMAEGMLAVYHSVARAN